jgi:hypothetical protein
MTFSAPAGVDPSGRRTGWRWSEFLHSHASATLACYFFTVESVPLHSLYALFFIKPGSIRGANIREQ